MRKGLDELVVKTREVKIMTRSSRGGSCGISWHGKNWRNQSLWVETRPKSKFHRVAIIKQCSKQEENKALRRDDLSSQVSVNILDKVCREWGGFGSARTPSGAERGRAGRAILCRNQSRSNGWNLLKVEIKRTSWRTEWSVLAETLDRASILMLHPP